MPDFTTALTAEAARFAYGERREVVVKNESFAVGTACIGVDLLGFV